MRPGLQRALAVLAALALAGCTGTSTDKGKPAANEETWFKTCDPKSGSGTELPCFTGGAQSTIQGPAVVNLWASWCAPCRQELPAFQRLADQGKVKVIGVVTLDDRSRALSTAKDLGVTFPALYDPEGKVHKSTGKSFLPITLFVDRDGKTVHTYTGAALDDATLAKLVEEKL
ncbi:TlpA disulfide reductase family protein [Longispora albida]|uniref:TlpA disulfide reductase family protein n=1 Tax=Longispora albida TaxID=203523 RepID=UPI00036BF246|nr:TlpA disulfide reductase family protein [Longispora albida]